MVEEELKRLINVIEDNIKLEDKIVQYINSLDKDVDYDPEKHILAINREEFDSETDNEMVNQSEINLRRVTILLNSHIPKNNILLLDRDKFGLDLSTRLRSDVFNE